MGQRPVESREARLRRLAAKAVAEGVEVLECRPENAMYATSVSHPGELYRLTLVSCSCLGFVGHGYCKHHALLLQQLGQLPRDPEPDPDGAAVVAELDRLEDLNRRHELKTTADVRGLHAARQRVAALVPCPVCGGALAWVGGGIFECSVEPQTHAYHGTYTVEDLAAVAGGTLSAAA